MIRLIAIAIAFAVVAATGCPVSRSAEPLSEQNMPRAQLSIGYTILSQEAKGIPKLKWILAFKDKPEEMGRLTHDLISYYQQLSERLQRLAKRYPAVHLDVQAMSKIESDERKAIGADQAKDFAPIAGKTGVDFEREALLMFYDALNEQRHLTGVMIDLEPDPGLKQFLITTKAQLEARYVKVGSLLDRRYFVH
jgi:hypothetical protein